MQASLKLATDDAAVRAIVRAGLDLDIPAAQDALFRQVSQAPAWMQTPTKPDLGFRV